MTPARGPSISNNILFNTFDLRWTSLKLQHTKSLNHVIHITHISYVHQSDDDDDDDDETSNQMKFAARNKVEM